MQLVVLSDEMLKKELVGNGVDEEIDLIWARDEVDLIRHRSADGFIDLLFENTQQRIELLKDLSARPVIVNSVVTTLEEINAPFIRINGWPGFLERKILEASYNDDSARLNAEKIFSSLNKKPHWVADEPGFVTPRVIAMIINEAYLALEEKVSTREEIDTAMKLGTNYPHGPFEWANKIGLKNVYGLLNELNRTRSRYKPAELLEREALK